VGQATVARSAESRAAVEFLNRVVTEPAGLVLVGEAGIGKTTVWLAAVNRAREMGFRVLSARTAEAESVLAYTAIADLLADVDASVLDALPAVQRVAVERVLLSGGSGGPMTDQRVAAAAFTATVEALAVDAPVLLAVDDVQWLDSSSRDVISFAARRVKGRVGVLVTERTEGDGGRAASWLQVSRPDVVATLRVGPLSLGGLHTLVSDRLGRSFPRPTITRIHEVSGGNPFFALELARSVESQGQRAQTPLSPTLAELMRLRTAHLADESGDVLLAAACVADPTVDVLAAATSRTVDDVVGSLESAECEGIVRIEGNRVRFDHPLLARGVYMQASTAERHRMHRALADVEAHPELKARHMALAAAVADPDTLLALDAAADAASARGAPAAAAELLDLAIVLGGDTPVRRFRAAAWLLAAGDTHRSRAVLEPAVATMKPGKLRASALNLLAGLCVYTNGYGEATGHLTTALDDAGDNPLLRVQTLLMLSFTQINDGAFADCLRNADLAVAEAEHLGIPPLTSQVLSIAVMVNCICGKGIDEDARQRALELEDHNLNAPIVFRASANEAQLLAWEGKLDAARAQIAEVGRRSEERGAESDNLFVAVQSVLIDIWRSDLAAAAETARDAVERAEQLGGDSSLLIATTVETAVAAYTGREADARAAWRRAVQAADRCGAHRVAEFPTMMLGFLEVSLGRYVEALALLEEMITEFPTKPTGTEVISATFIPDAVEAMVGLGRVDDAEPLIAALEHNGARLDRPWMLAVGARCRAMVLAARGELPEAEETVRRAMAEHERLPMPFERARTQLLLSQILRRRKQKQAGVTVLAEALSEFDRIGASLWAARARDDLDRNREASTGGPGLTAAEQRVAARAAAGSSNREIAAELFVSVKTVESNLSSVYRKLGIRSRSQLYAQLNESREQGAAVEGVG
jgi:DNA-binding CsgD family transcriptional regulator/tetratricopeptide (TPR) repeat protein